MLPISILDLALVGEGETVADALEHSRRAAVQAEELGYNRIWLAEHHGMRGIASSATALVISHLANATRKIRIGAGGVMLPNHAPLVIAEQFGTLETLYPGRIDLGLGRAPGSDAHTMRALRRDPMEAADTYPQDLNELLEYIGPERNRGVPAIPGEGSNVPVWLLGSSLYSAQLAALLGLPFAFASHFAPRMLLDAISLYRENFRPSKYLDKPWVMAGVMSSVADTDEEAEYLFSSAREKFAEMGRGTNRKFPKPSQDLESRYDPFELSQSRDSLKFALVGSQQTVGKKLDKLLALTQLDELIVSFPIHDIEARLHALELMAGLEQKAPADWQAK